MDLPIDPVTNFVDFLQNPNTPRLSRSEIEQKRSEILGHVYEQNHELLAPHVDRLIDCALERGGRSWRPIAGVAFFGIAVAGGIGIFFSNHWSNSVLLGIGIVGGSVSIWTKGSSQPVVLNEGPLRVAFMDKAFRGNGWVPNHKFRDTSDNLEVENGQFWPEYGSSNAENSGILLKYRQAYGFMNVGLPETLLEPVGPFQPDYLGDSEADRVIYATAVLNNAQVVRPASVNKVTLDQIDLEQGVALLALGPQEMLRKQQEQEVAERRGALQLITTRFENILKSLPQVPDFLAPWLGAESQKLQNALISHRQSGPVFTSVMNGSLSVEQANTDSSAVIQTHEQSKAIVLQRQQEAAGQIYQIDIILTDEASNSLQSRPAVEQLKAAWVAWASGASNEKPSESQKIMQRARAELAVAKRAQSSQAPPASHQNSQPPQVDNNTIVDDAQGEAIVAKRKNEADSSILEIDQFLEDENSIGLECLSEIAQLRGAWVSWASRDNDVKPTNHKALLRKAKAERNVKLIMAKKTSSNS